MSALAMAHSPHPAARYAVVVNPQTPAERVHVWCFTRRSAESWKRDLRRDGQPCCIRTRERRHGSDRATLPRWCIGVICFGAGLAAPDLIAMLLRGTP